MQRPYIHVLAFLALMPTIHLAMEQQATAAERTITVQQLLGMACAEPKLIYTPWYYPLVGKPAVPQERVLQYVATIETTQDFKALLSAETPQQVKMDSERILDTLLQSKKVFDTEYRDAWAPKTGAAAALCCLISCLKPCSFGLLDSLPSEEATIGLFGFWNGLVYENRGQRTSINNGSFVAALIKEKLCGVLEKKVHSMQNQRADGNQSPEAVIGTNAAALGATSSNNNNTASNQDEDLDTLLEEADDQLKSEEERERIAQEAEQTARKNKQLTDKEKKNQ